MRGRCRATLENSFGRSNVEGKKDCFFGHANLSNILMMKVLSHLFKCSFENQNYIRKPSYLNYIHAIDWTFWKLYVCNNSRQWIFQLAYVVLSWGKVRSVSYQRIFFTLWVTNLLSQISIIFLSHILVDEVKCDKISIIFLDHFFSLVDACFLSISHQKILKNKIKLIWFDILWASWKWTNCIKQTKVHTNRIITTLSYRLIDINNQQDRRSLHLS